MPDLLHSLASMFPVGNRSPPGSETSQNAMTLLFAYLPSRPRAWTLCETFLEQAFCLFRQRDELIQDILTPVYAAKEEREILGSVATSEVSPHKNIHSVLGILSRQSCRFDSTSVQ